MAEASTWRLSLEVPREAVALFEIALEVLDGALVSDHVEDGPVPLALHLEARPEPEALAALVESAAHAAGISAPDFKLEEVTPRDWVAESQCALPPIRAGRFYLHGSHVSGPPPGASIPILVDAGAAFGTGRHESTRGCLLMLERLARRRQPQRPLDLGCGSGVLAIAMAKLWPVSVLATDNDPLAVPVARENARINGVAGRVATVESDGFKCLAVTRRAPFDLIVANILAEPLTAMARDLARHVTRPGAVVLSGLLAEQERSLLAHYRLQGLPLLGRVRLGGWVTLMVGR
ncbi:MAG: 50S ribosomal protein L11 methyltransferase [Pseudomonadota bacterium]